MLRVDKAYPFPVGAAYVEGRVQSKHPVMRSGRGVLPAFFFCFQLGERSLPALQEMLPSMTDFS